jgi:rRNA maturation endonuclease Nob1
VFDYYCESCETAFSIDVKPSFCPVCGLELTLDDEVDEEELDYHEKPPDLNVWDILQ